MSELQSQEIRRLQWQCRRGLLELDLLLSRFLERCYPELEPAGQDAFRRLLRQPDASVLAWLQRQQEPPRTLKNIVTLIVQYNDY